MKRPIFTATCGITVALAAASCGATEVVVLVDGEPDTLAITIVDFNSVVVEDLILEVGQTAQLDATGLDALGQPVGPVPATWSSTNPGVASVTNSEGVVTARSEGTTDIMAFFQDLTAAIPTRVIAAEDPPSTNARPGALIASPSQNVTVTLGDAVNFQGTASDSDGTVASHTWSFGDGNSASVEDPGNHTYAGVGSYSVTYRVTDDQGAQSPIARRTVTVQDGPQPPPPPPSGPLLVASDWTSGGWSDGGKWGNESDWVRDGRAVVVAGAAGEPWPSKLRIVVNNSNDSWIQMMLNGGPAPALGQPVTIRWYERIMLPDSWNGDELTHGIALGNTNGTQPWLNYWTRANGTYRMEVQVAGDFDNMFAHPGWLNKRAWYRMEWTIIQEAANRVRMAINVYDLAGNRVFQPSDFTDWPWSNGQTDLTEKTWALDLRSKQTKLVGWLSGLAGLSQQVTWAEYAAVAIVLGDSVGPYDAARGW